MNWLSLVTGHKQANLGAGLKPVLIVSQPPKTRAHSSPAQPPPHLAYALCESNQGLPWTLWVGRAREGDRFSSMGREGSPGA